jgi:hypothetical protein
VFLLCSGCVGECDCYNENITVKDKTTSVSTGFNNPIYLVKTVEGKVYRVDLLLESPTFQVWYSMDEGKTYNVTICCGCINDAVLVGE